jgi:nucleotide-binding universal stress UspA family protein
MKQILVATDFSTCAGNAMEYALGLAKILHVEVCAIHAMSANEGVDNNIFNAIYIEDYHNNKRQALATWASTFTANEEFKDVSVSSTVEIGGLIPVLNKYIEANPVELLVLGTMGSTGISGIFGSNANSIILKIKKPTLIVPLESKYLPNPVITLATDFNSNLSAEDVNALNELIHAFSLKKLNVVNVIEGPDWKTNETGENKLRILIDKADLEFKYISENSTTDGIMNFIVSSQTDILCIVKHHQNLIYRIFNRSTVNQVMNRSIKAILVLHE